MSNPSLSANPTFEASYPEIQRIVQSRRGAWKHLSLMTWEEVKAAVVSRIWMQWRYYNPDRGPLENWCNTVISNALKNLVRDLRGRWERPCLGGGKANGSSCVHNLGGTTCEVTPSRTQCSECPLYADWAKTRQHQFNIKSTVALNNHAQEVSSVQGDFCDVEEVEETMHRQMRANLTRWEHRIYVMLYVEHLSPAETGVRLEALVKTWKRAPRADEEYGYQFILGKQRWFRELMKDALAREGYDVRRFQKRNDS